MRPGLVDQARHDFMPRSGDAHHCDAPVRVVGVTFDVALFFHAVEQAGHGGLLGDGHLGQAADAHALAVGEGGQYAPFGHREAAGLDHGVEFSRYQAAGLGQQGRQVAFDKWEIGWGGHGRGSRVRRITVTCHQNAWAR